MKVSKKDSPIKRLRVSYNPLTHTLMSRQDIQEMVGNAHKVGRDEGFAAGASVAKVAREEMARATFGDLADVWSQVAVLGSMAGNYAKTISNMYRTRAREKDGSGEEKT